MTYIKSLSDDKDWCSVALYWADEGDRTTCSKCSTPISPKCLYGVVHAIARDPLCRDCLRATKFSFSLKCDIYDYLKATSCPPDNECYVQHLTAAMRL